MNFQFSEEQHLLRDSARSFLNEHSSLTCVREVLEKDTPYSQNLWYDMIDLGWTGTTIPEQYGGLGLGYLELCVLAEELGRSLAPVPFSSSIYLASEALLAAGSEEQKARYLPRLASGEMIGTVAHFETQSLHSPQRAIQTHIVEDKIIGEKSPVTDGSCADLAIVSAKDDSAAGFSFYIINLNGASVRRQTLKSIDPSRKATRIILEEAPFERLGEAGQGPEILNLLRNKAAVLFAFEQLGGAERALDISLEYAKQRFAFGRPIGSFQAIKHKLADMYVAKELARANNYYAAFALDNDTNDLAIAAATARISATQAFDKISQDMLQIHGGMGFTWEADCHIFYRRARFLSLNLGSLRVWQDYLIQQLLLNERD